MLFIRQKKNCWVHWGELCIGLDILAGLNATESMHADVRPLNNLDVVCNEDSGNIFQNYSADVHF